MKPTQTGIAIALALVVVVMFFILPGMSLFGSTTGSSAAALTGTNNQTANLTASTTMPTTPTTPVTELIMQDEIVGTGAAAATGDTVMVNYVGALTDGTVFDASANHGNTGFTFKLGAGLVIKGWDQGIVGMKEGGKRKLLIPASLAYGSQANGPIPANSALIFEVELLTVQK